MNINNKNLQDIITDLLSKLNLRLRDIIMEDNAT